MILGSANKLISEKVSEKVLERLEKNGFAKLCGLEVLEAHDGYAKGRFILGPQHMNPIGSVHGGCVFTLMDSIGGFAAYTNGRYCTTLSSNVDYLRPAMNCKELIAEATPVRVGNRVMVYDVVVTDETDRKIARGSITFYSLDKINE